jgi:hypothetical protein
MCVIMAIILKTSALDNPSLFFYARYMPKTAKKKKAAKPSVKSTPKSSVREKKMAAAAGIAYGLLALVVIGAAIILLMTIFAPKDDIIQNSQTPAVSTDTPTPPVSPSTTDDNSGY